MMARAAPASRTARRESISRIPPPTSTGPAKASMMRAMTSACLGSPANAPSRSTTCSSRPPCSRQSRACAAGSSPYTVTSSARPCLRRTHFPSFRSIAGSITMSDDPLRGRDALLVRVDGLGLAERAREALEEPLANVVRLVSVYLAEVDVRAGLDRDGAEELLDELHLEVPHEHVLHRALHDEERTPPEVERSLAQRLVHRNRRKTVADDPLPVAERLVDRLAEHKHDVLDGVVVVDVNVAHRLDREVDQRVLLQKLKHVVEESDPRVDSPLARTVEVQLEAYLRLLRVAFNLRCSHADIIS